MLVAVQGYAAGAADALPAGGLPHVRIAVAGPSGGAQAKTAEAIASEAGATAKWLTMLSQQNARAPQGLSTRMLPARYEVTIKDDGCDAARAEAVAKEIVTENFDLVLGHPCPKAALAAAKVYGTAGVTFIATWTRHPGLTAKRAGPSIFRLSGRDDAQGLDAVRYLSAAHGGKPVAIVHDRTLYAKTIAGQTAAALMEKKIEIITATIVAGDKEYGKLIAKIKDAGAVFFAGFPLEAGFIVKELRASGSNVPLLASESVGTDEFVATFPEVAQQVFVLRAQLSNQLLASGTTAVRLYAQVLGGAFGPVKDAAGWRLLVNDALARHHHRLIAIGMENTFGFPEDLTHDIAFDATGNAKLGSYTLTRWNGAVWETNDALR